MRYLGAPIAATLGFLGFYFLLSRDASAGFFAEKDVIKWAQLTLVYLLVVFGVMLGGAYRFLAMQSPELPAFRQWMGKLALSRDLWVGLVASPVVYALLLNTTRGMELSGMAIIALQNGFTAQIVVEQFLKGRGGSTPKP